MLQQRPPSLHMQRTACKRIGWLHTHNPPRNKASIHPRMRRSTRLEGELPLLLPHLLCFLSLYVALILHRPYCSEFCKKSRSVTSESKHILPLEVNGKHLEIQQEELCCSTASRAEFEVSPPTPQHNITLIPPPGPALQFLPAEAGGSSSPSHCDPYLVTGTCNRESCTQLQ